ncbi:MAG: hypothetical protein ACD_42C00064G0001 [uncultured bacterium]|nr:MAG: hypothetical protein ACD_42C00064G0001 [uncultured bacterium]
MLQRAADSASIKLTESGAELSLLGVWLIDRLYDADRWVQKLSVDASHINLIDASNIKEMDTAGAFLVFLLHQKIVEKNPQVTISGLKSNFQSLFTLISNEIKKAETTKVAPPHFDLLYHIGKKSTELYQNTLAMFGFLGEVFVLLYATLLKPARLQWRSMVHEIDLGGYRALPIIAVMMFLIGVVVAYQLGVQLRIYGANVYMVDLSGVAILREFSPLIASVIIAGRTSTSFAALIGTMKVNEEIDALRTMGLSPIERLVLPKILGLLVALPLLVVWGDLFGLLGSMLITKNMAGITFQAFLDRFKAEVAIKHLYIGLIKTPIFALIIAGIGCFQGFQAEGSAQSVGERTTKAAVQAIFLIILADGLFSILFNWMDI